MSKSRGNRNKNAAKGETKAAVRLNIGGGDFEIPGYVTIDRKRGLEANDLPYESGTVDEIYASHILEHFGQREVEDVLREWHRVLKVGGIIRVAVPNFAWICQAYQQEAKDVPIVSYLMGGQTDRNDFHKCVFDEGLLTSLLYSSGFGEVTKFEPFANDCTRLEVSLNLQAKKVNMDKSWNGITDAEEFKKLSKIVAAMSIPRLGFTDNMLTAPQICDRLCIPLTRASGVFWGQSLTLLFKMAQEAGAEYILTVDYDTLFTAHDLLRLWKIMEANPQIDALFPIQVRRESPEILMTITDADGKKVTSVSSEALRSDFVKVRSGHFGLTLIRVKSLEKIPKPWFIGVPDENGEWGQDRIDEDVNFWLKLGNAGGNVCVCPRVVIGHMQLMVTWPDIEFKPLYQNVGAYERVGKPGGVWK